jgi:hypothetical protein
MSLLESVLRDRRVSYGDAEILRYAQDDITAIGNGSNLAVK